MFKDLFKNNGENTDINRENSSGTLNIFFRNFVNSN